MLDGVIGATLIDLEELKSSIIEGGKELEETEPARENLKMAWFKKLPEKHVLQYKSTVNLSGTKEPSQGIISWFFDSEVKLFVIKRYDGT